MSNRQRLQQENAQLQAKLCQLQTSNSIRQNTLAQASAENQVISNINNKQHEKVAELINRQKPLKAQSGKYVELNEMLRENNRVFGDIIAMHIQAFTVEFKELEKAKKDIKMFKANHRYLVHKYSNDRWVYPGSN
ncbi:hypothetical protein LPJ66_010540 [Kickxella alabastrina]|uniref:Uncharacterized protein n=1 Tax=Kickxella alabastrina TaxID=61397 RepID=A0ACC1I066_9FUNG|nr:hypothetical protein LPJ66_010540 [Kickxella alabastrina]